MVVVEDHEWFRDDCCEDIITFRMFVYGCVVLGISVFVCVCVCVKWREEGEIPRRGGAVRMAICLLYLGPAEAETEGFCFRWLFRVGLQALFLFWYRCRARVDLVLQATGECVGYS